MQGLMQDFPLTIPHLFERAERLFGHRELVSVTPTTTTRTTYGAWAARTRRLGGVLDALGVSAGGRVGTFAWNSTRHLELYFAVPCSGRVLHTLNVRAPHHQIAYAARHAQDEVIFVDRSLVGLLWPVVEELPEVRHVVVMDDGDGEVPDDLRIRDYEALLTNAGPVEFHVDDEHRAAGMCYTSGTTGDPKGVVYSHRSTVLHTFSVLFADSVGMREADSVLPLVPMFHANGWGLPHGAVACGARLVFPGEDLSAGTVADLLEAERITVTAGVPTIWMGVLPELADRDVSALRIIQCGGSAVPRALSEAYRERIGLPITQAWGMTETSPVCTAGRLREHHLALTSDEQAHLRTSVGYVSPGVEMRICDPDTGEELAWDATATGELQMRGPWVARSYYDDERSEGSFTSDGWLRTGDVARVNSEGYIWLVDRTKDLVKSGGEWISSAEVENEIMAHPDVAEAAVIAVTSTKWSERPLACVVRREGTSLDEGSLIDFLAARLPKWWVPDAVEFIDEIPKTSVGKFSKKTLREKYGDLLLP